MHQNIVCFVDGSFHVQQQLADIENDLILLSGGESAEIPQRFFLPDGRNGQLLLYDLFLGFSALVDQIVEDGQYHPLMVFFQQKDIFPFHDILYQRNQSAASVEHAPYNVQGITFAESAPPQKLQITAIVAWTSLKI